MPQKRPFEVNDLQRPPTPVSPTPPERPPAPPPKTPTPPLQRLLTPPTPLPMGTPPRAMNGTPIPGFPLVTYNYEVSNGKVYCMPSAPPKHARLTNKG